MQNSKKASQIATLILFLALIRTIAEPLRLQYYSHTKLVFLQIKPFLIAGLITATALLAITILFYYARYKTIIAVAIINIIIMLVIKWMMLWAIAQYRTKVQASVATYAPSVIPKPVTKKIFIINSYYKAKALIIICSITSDIGTFEEPELIAYVSQF